MVSPVQGARMIKSELIAKLAEENPHLTSATSNAWSVSSWSG